ncbi:unnamed protein product, partial [Gongylonema pulchrum]|uniref:C2H2-type domain-containing protein n=1 Tax=Gongylonema pulchrum TaxID=637853 RepID=A0A183DLS0_9BILA
MEESFTAEFLSPLNEEPPSAAVAGVLIMNQQQQQQPQQPPLQHQPQQHQPEQIKQPANAARSTQQVYRCEACNKTVSSSRSLKRHRGTCRQYNIEYGHLNQTSSTNAQ